jgi:hypothetical protein
MSSAKLIDVRTRKVCQCKVHEMIPVYSVNLVHKANQSVKRVLNSERVQRQAVAHKFLVASTTVQLFY